MIKIKCITCKKDFNTFESRIKIGKGKFCSKKCYYIQEKGRPAWNKGKEMWKIRKHPMLGKHHTENSRKKLSISRLGKNLGNKNGFIKGQSAWNKGIKFPRIANEKNYLWKGEGVSYVGLHKWVKRHKGKPDKCEHCGTMTAKRLEWANVNHLYKRILSDYISLCTRCHRKYDIKFNNYSKLRTEPIKTAPHSM